MSNIPVARRYARALLDIAQGKADGVLEELEALTTFLKGQPELMATLSSPVVSRSQRSAIVAALVKAIPGLSATVINLLKLLTDRNRFASLPAISRQFRDLVDAKVGRIRGQVTSAVALSKEQLAQITTSLEALTQSKVMLEAKLDKGLLGGVVAQVGSKVYDGSLRSQLRTMAQELGR